MSFTFVFQKISEAFVPHQQHHSPNEWTVLSNYTNGSPFKTSPKGPFSNSNSPLQVKASRPAFLQKGENVCARSQLIDIRSNLYGCYDIQDKKIKKLDLSFESSVSVFCITEDCRTSKSLGVFFPPLLCSTFHVSSNWLSANSCIFSQGTQCQVEVDLNSIKMESIQFNLSEWVRTLVLYRDHININFVTQIWTLITVSGFYACVLINL